MTWCIIFTVTGQIERKNRVLLGECLHIPPPAEGATQQSMQQQKRPSGPGARVVDLASVHLSSEFLDLQWLLGQPLFRFGHSNWMLSPLSLLIAGFLQEDPAFFKLFCRIWDHLLPKTGNTKSHREIPISVAFQL